MSYLSINETAKKNREEGARRLPIRASVRNPVPLREAAYLDTALASNASEFTLRHPYFSNNSWIRCMPESGTAVLTQERGDSASGEITGYLVEPSDVVKRIKDTQEETGIFRILKAGEIEIMSKGRAYAYFSESGDLELMGGLIRQDLLQTELEMKTQAPTFKRVLHLYEPDKLAHEERFGVVKRPHDSKPGALQKFVRNDDDEFAQEYGRWLNKLDGSVLTSLQEGEVYDATGKIRKQTSTNKPLRYEKVIKHRSSGDIALQVDNESNISYINSTKAKETKIVFGTKNTVDASGEGLKGSFTKTGNLSFTTSFSLRSRKVRVKSSDVGFGQAPTINAVLGTNLNTSVLTPGLSAILTFMTVMSSDPTIHSALPQISAAAKQAVPQLTAAVAALPSILSKEVKLTG